MSSFDAQNKAVRDKMLCVNEFIRTAKLPQELSKQVRDFFEFKLARSQHAFLISSNYDVDEVSGDTFLFDIIFNYVSYRHACDECGSC